MTETALIVIDIQNDYFPDGKYPQWRTNEQLQKTNILIDKAKQKDWLVVLVQHTAKEGAPFLVENSYGAEIHPEILTNVIRPKIVIKKYADSFLETDLHQVLQQAQISSLYLCGMMTQNCVTHTALSKQAETYQIHVVSDACSAPDELVHKVAINALSCRVCIDVVDVI